jgi:hypothetical protein
MIIIIVLYVNPCLHRLGYTIVSQYKFLTCVSASDRYRIAAISVVRIEFNLTISFSSLTAGKGVSSRMATVICSLLIV